MAVRVGADAEVTVAVAVVRAGEEAAAVAVAGVGVATVAELGQTVGRRAKADHIVESEGGPVEGCCSTCGQREVTVR